jgi:hypothetical protein
MKNQCPRCNRTPEGDNKYCSACLEKTREYWAERRSGVPAGVCKKCCVNTTEAGFKWCVSCRGAQAKAMQAYRDRSPEKAKQLVRDWRKTQREKVLRHYGGSCACCGEREFKFLVLDHKNGGGNAHRVEVRQNGGGMISWAIKNNYPDLFRVLCHNCNSAIGFYGSCPHQRG